MRLKPWLKSIPIALVLLQSVARKATAQSNPPNPEKHERSAAIHAKASNQDNQSALEAALIEALRTITQQEGTATKESGAEQEAFLPPWRIQEGFAACRNCLQFLCLAPMESHPSPG